MRPFILLLFLVACSQTSDQPGQVAPDEAQALNDAAEMLDANSVDLNAVTADEPAEEGDT